MIVRDLFWLPIFVLIGGRTRRERSMSTSDQLSSVISLRRAPVNMIKRMMLA
jgi:hypothetical protein